MGKKFLLVILPCDPHLAVESQKKVAVQGILVAWTYMAGFGNSVPQNKKENC